MVYADRCFFLSSEVKAGGMTYQKHYEHVARQKKQPIENFLKIPRLPECFEHLWDWFRECKTAEPLTYSELKAWAKMTQKTLTVFEVKTIMDLDHAYNVFKHDKRDK